MLQVDAPLIGLKRMVNNITHQHIIIITVLVLLGVGYRVVFFLVCFQSRKNRSGRQSLLAHLQTLHSTDISHFLRIHPAKVAEYSAMNATCCVEE